MWKQWVAAILILATLSGCQTSVSDEKARAHTKWDVARASVMVGAADEQLKIGKLDRAQQHASEALALAPQMPEALAILGRIYIERGQYSAAIIELEKALEQSPRSSSIAYLLGVAYEKSGNLAEALTSYQKASRLDVANFHAVVAEVEVLAAMGKLTEGLDLLEGRLDQAGDDPTGYELCGRLSMILGEYTKAENYYRTACVLDPKNMLYVKSLGQAHFANGHYREAVAAMTKVTGQKAYEPTFMVYAVLGDSYLALGDARNARDAFYTATELAPSEWHVWLGLAKAYLAADEAPRAVLAAQQALRLSADNIDATMLLSYALMRDNRPIDAAAALGMAIRHNPQNAMLRCLQGKAYAAAGRREAALLSYRAALKLEPDNRLARELIAALNGDVSRAD